MYSRMLVWGVVGCALLLTGTTAVAGDNGKWLLDVDIIPYLDSVTNESCRTHTRLLLAHLAQWETWAFQMMDASGKPGSGILNGNTNQLGDYHQCVSVQQEELGISGQYCLATVFADLRQDETSPEWAKIAALLDLAYSHNAVRSTHDDDIRFLPTFTPVSWGVCVPSSCSSSDVEAAFSLALSKFNRTFDLHVSVKQNDCEAYKPRNFLKAKTLLTVFIFLSILLTAIAGTVYEYSQPDNNGSIMHHEHTLVQKVMLAFSFRKNMTTLLDTNMQMDDISCVHGIRFIFSVIIYLLHRSLLGLFVPLANRTETAKLLESEWTMVFRAIWNNVDVFVVLSGLLTSYYATKSLQSGQKLNISSMYIRRYIKFTPMFMVAVFFIRNVSTEIVRGPQVIRIANHFISRCQDIWKPLSYTSTFDGINNMCYPPSHQLVTDMHMYLFAPFVVLLLWHFNSRGVICTAGILFCLAVYRAVTIYTKQLGTYIYYGATLAKLSESGDQLYLNPLYRFTPCIIGILLGFILRTTNIKSTRLSHDELRLGWVMAGVAIHYSMFGPQAPYSRNYRYDVVDSTIYGSIQPLAWSLSLAWIIFVCHTQQATFLNNALSWKGFIVFSRISYAFYVTQLLVIFYNIVSAQVPQHVSLLQIIDLNEIVVLLGVSVLSTLLFVLPISELYVVFSGTENVQKKEAIKSN